MVSEVIRAEVNLNPAECIDPILEKDRESAIAHVKATCAKTVEEGSVPDLNALAECLDFSHFCGSCCNYFIGYAQGE
jgi:hypothetical protein